MPLDTSTIVLVGIFSLTPNSIGIKEEFHRKSTRKQTDCMKFSSTSKTCVQRCLYPLFQNQCHCFLLLHLFQRISQASGMNQQNDKQITDYHPSPSQLASRIHALIFMRTPKGFISP